MSCRHSFSSALRHVHSGLVQQQSKTFSTSASVAALNKGLFPQSNTSNQTTRNTKQTWTTRSNPTDALQSIISERAERGAAPTLEEQRQMMAQQSTGSGARDLRISQMTDNYMRQMPRRWKVGDVYAPKDLSPLEMKKWKSRQSKKQDIVDLLGFNPIDNYKNFSMISEFVTTMGRIKHSQETGLRPVNQRKMAKAIRRAIGMGLHPSVHKHPEILRRTNTNLPVTVSGSSTAQSSQSSSPSL